MMTGFHSTDSEAHFRNLADHAPVMIWMAGTDGHCTFFNQPWLSFTGRSMQQELGEGWAEGVHPDDLEKCLGIYRTSLEEQINFQMEYRLRRADGHYRWILDTGTPLFSETRKFEGYIGSAIDITLYKQVETALRDMRDQLEERVQERTAQFLQANETLRHLALRLQNAREEERKKIARDVHDNLSQELTVLKMELASLARLLASKKSTTLAEQGAARLQPLIQSLDAMIQSSVKICTELRPGILDELGLVAAIDWQAREFQNRSGIVCKLSIDPRAELRDKDQALAVFRSFQEILANIARHAEAKHATIELQLVDGRVRLRVHDDGRGIQPSQIDSVHSLGLLGIRERLLPFGGVLTIEGAPTAGTTVQVEIPVEDSRHA